MKANCLFSNILYKALQVPVEEVAFWPLRLTSWLLCCRFENVCSPHSPAIKFPNSYGLPSRFFSPVAFDLVPGHLHLMRSLLSSSISGSLARLFCLS